MHGKIDLSKMRISIDICYLTVSILLFVPNGFFAQNPVTKTQQAVVLKDVCEKLDKYYAFPETGARLIRLIQNKVKIGGYSYNVTPGEFLEEVNDDLFEISRDKHLKLIYNPKEAKALSEAKFGADVTDPEIESERWRNFGFKELEILDGNIGYMNLSDFCSVKYAGEKAATAMNFFSDCNALIIDLRQNGGGSDDMVVFLVSYFIDLPEPIVFSISYSTIDSTYYSSMSSSYVPGKKFTGIPVYILTSHATASAAEAFTDIMKNYNQNVIIAGTKTRGAENPVSHLVVGSEYILRLPSWRKIYSSSKTQWEGRGINPDIHVEEGKALTVAHIEVLNKLMESTPDNDALSHYRWAYDGVKALYDPVVIAQDILKSYMGNYSGRAICYENGNLYYGTDKKKLIPISENYFLVESTDYFRIRFIKENDKVVALERVFVYGYSSRHSRE
jgi:hypothetical protein